MLRVVKALAVAMVVSGLAGTALAKPVIYTCYNSSNRTNAHLKSELLISYDAAKDQVLVTDRAILGRNGQPIAGKMKTDNGTRTVFSWVLKNAVNSARQTTTLQFTGTYFKANGKFTLKIVPVGYRNIFIDRGTCTVK
jgi:hypothetical protein